MRKSFLKIAVLMTLGGTVPACTMMPEFVRPEFSAAQQWSTLPGYTSQEGKVAARSLSWQQFFKDPALAQVIGIALENNKDAKLAALNIAEARSLYRIERSDLLPAINANGNANIQRTSDESSFTGRSDDTETYAANVGLASYELDLFGRLRSQNQAALNEFFSTQVAEEVVQNALIAEVANAYLQLLADQDLLKLTEQTLNAQLDTYDLLSRTRDEGIATESEVSRAQTAVETARVNLHQYKRYVQQDKNALILLLGIAHDDALIPVSSINNIQLPDNIGVGLPAEVLIARPDVRQAEYLLKARNADIGAARAAFFPKISLTGSYGFASDSLSKLFTSGGLGAWSFLPQITMPIFNGGANVANLDLAQIRKEKAVVSYEQVIQTAFREVADELAAQATLSEQLKAQKRLVEAAQRVYDVSDARYNAGIDSFLSVLDAQRELYAYQQQEIQLERQRLTNLINLYKVVGGGSNIRT